MTPFNIAILNILTIITYAILVYLLNLTSALSLISLIILFGVVISFLALHFESRTDLAMRDLKNIVLDIKSNNFTTAPDKNNRYYNINKLKLAFFDLLEIVQLEGNYSKEHKKALSENRKQLLEYSKILEEKVIEKSKTLKDQALSYDNLYINSPNSIALVEDMFILECNSSFQNMFKCTKNRLLIKLDINKLSPIYQPDGELSSKKMIQEIENLNENGTNTFEWVCLNGIGEEFWVEISGSKIIVNGKVCSHLLFKDIDKRKEIETAHTLLSKSLKKQVNKEVHYNRIKDKQLQHQARLAQMGEMIGMIAHQWRQPLNAISLTSGNLLFKSLMGDVENKLLVKELENIDSYTQNLSEIIDEFRGFFADSKHLQLVSLDKIVKDTVKIIEDTMLSQNIRIITSGDCDDEFYTYSNELKQALLALLQNSKEALLDRKIKDATIIIRVDCSIVSEHTVVVEDNAGGVAEDIIDKIFNPYFSTKKEKDGVGLGLYISKQSVEDYCAGKLSMENGTNGAIFKMTIPDKKNENE